MTQISSVLFAIILFACYFFLRMARENLSAEQQAILFDIRYGKRNFFRIIMPLVNSIIPIDILIGLVICYVGMTWIKFIAIVVDKPATVLYIVGVPILFILAILITLWRRICVYKRLKASGLPESYLCTVLITNVVIYISLVGYALTIAIINMH